MLWIILPIPAAIVEMGYSRRIYPSLAWVVISLTDWFAFSLAGVGLVVIPIFLVWWLVGYKKRVTLSLRVVGSVAVWGLALYGGFVLLWGANYRRESIEKILNLQPALVQTTDLERLAQNLLAVIQDNAAAPQDYSKALVALRVAIGRQLEQVQGFMPTLPTRVKATPAGLLLLLRTSGVVSPLTLEAHVDAALPEPFFLACATHELVHTAGFAGEADTDLIAALSGLQATDGYARYSVALWYYAKILGDVSGEFRQSLRGRLPEVAKNDYLALRTALEQYRVPALADAAQYIYNQYLQSQGVEAGVKDYSRIGRLLAAAQRQKLIFR